MLDFLKPFFWDIDISTLDLKIHKQSIISRLFSYGDDEAVKWVLKTYTKQDIIDCAKNSRQFTKKAAEFLKNVYDLKEDEMIYYINAKKMGNYYFI